MSTRPQLSGPVAIPREDPEDLRVKLTKALHRIEDLELELQKTKNESRRSLSAIANLQRALEPITKALRYINGEIDSVDLPETSATVASSPDGRATGQPDRFEGIKRMVSAKQADVITALQTFGPSTLSQVIASAGQAFDTAKRSLYALRDRGVVEKNGDKWVLK